MTYTHKHYNKAQRAYYATSFSPERRGESQCRYFDETILELESIGCSAEGLAKFESLFLNMLDAKSRCMSSMITGPANFPVARAQKANDREHNARQKMFDYVVLVKKAIDRQKNPTKYGISSDHPEAIALLKQQVAGLEATQAYMKAVNRLIRKKPVDMEALAELVGGSLAAHTLLKPNYMGKVCGYETFQLSNNNANIKRVKGRITELESKQEQTTKEYDVNGVKVVENVEDNRLQLLFDGKPKSDTIGTLKRHGFRWSPRNMAWQRQLTVNALYSYTHFIKPHLSQTTEA